MDYPFNLRELIRIFDCEIEGETPSSLNHKKKTMKFETPKDFARQELAAKYFCDKYAYCYSSQGDFSSVDYEMKNKNFDRMCGFEVKGCPNQNIDSYENCIVSMKKIVDCQEEQIKYGKPVVICWAFDDGILFDRIDNLTGTFKKGGRKPRKGSVHDQEMIVVVERKNLQKILY
tara:strand:- start:635 stop:1156 length:522 start_codon:yes stop_codon:yes gene_type:complete